MRSYRRSNSDRRAEEGGEREQMTVYVFDADGVLLDSRQAHGRLLFDFAKEYNCELPETVNGYRIEEPGDVFPAMRSPMTAVFKDFGFPEERLPELMERYREELPRYGLEPYPGVFNAIKTVNSRTGIVTSNYRAVVETFLQQQDASQLFDIVIGLEDVNQPKPDPEPLHRCIQHLGVDPAKLYYVGDSPSDVAAATRLREDVSFPVETVGVTWGYHPDTITDADPDHVLEDPERLATFLDQ